MAFFKVLHSETKDELVLPPAFVRENFDPSFVMKRVIIIYNMSKYWQVTLKRISKTEVVICDGWKDIVQDLRLTKLTMLVFTPFLPFADWMLSAYDGLYVIVNEPHKRIIFPNMFVSDHLQQDTSKVLYKLMSDEDYVREVVVEKIGDEFCFTEGLSKVIEKVGLEFSDFVHFQYIGVKSFKMTIFNPNGTQRKIKKLNEAEQFVALFSTPVNHRRLDETPSFLILYLQSDRRSPLVQHTAMDQLDGVPIYVIYLTSRFCKRCSIRFSND